MVNCRLRHQNSQALQCIISHLIRNSLGRVQLTIKVGYIYLETDNRIMKEDRDSIDINISNNYYKFYIII